jgi:hypothetical protein
VADPSGESVPELLRPMLHADPNSAPGGASQSISNVVRFLGYDALLTAGRARGYGQLEACNLNLDREAAAVSTDSE